jgi:hypothetical protein
VYKSKISLISFRTSPRPCVRTGNQYLSTVVLIFLETSSERGTIIELFDSGGKFQWGINIDNVWIYSGLPPPKSEIVPFLVSLRLSRGPIDTFEHPNLDHALNEHNQLAVEELESPNAVEEVCQDLVARLKDAKISVVRAWFPWNYFTKNLEPANNDNMQSPMTLEYVMDTFVETLRSNGIGVLGVLANGYSRFLPRGADVENLRKYMIQLVPSCEQIVRHYKGAIDTWQIENEPNWWRGHVAVDWRKGLIWLEHDSEELILEALYKVVRQECPNGKVMINVEADRRPNNWGLYAKYADVIGLDFYPAYAHPHLTSAEEIKSLSSEVKKQTGKQLVVAETGQPSGPELLGYSEDKQAEFVRSACEEAFTSDVLDGLFIWRYSDSYWRSFPMQENHFGLLTKERKPKKAWGEYADQIRGKS